MLNLKIKSSMPPKIPIFSLTIEYEPDLISAFKTYTEEYFSSENPSFIGKYTSICNALAYNIPEWTTHQNELTIPSPDFIKHVYDAYNDAGIDSSYSKILVSRVFYDVFNRNLTESLSFMDKYERLRFIDTPALNISLGYSLLTPITYVDISKILKTPDELMALFITSDSSLESVLKNETSKLLYGYMMTPRHHTYYLLNKADHTKQHKFLSCIRYATNANRLNLLTDLLSNDTDKTSFYISILEMVSNSASYENKELVLKIKDIFKKEHPTTYNTYDFLKSLGTPNNELLAMCENTKIDTTSIQLEY